MQPHQWEEKYQTDDAHWDHGGPAPGLVEFLQDRRRLPRGRVAVPGCGTGHDVRAWARFGFEAHGFDIAPTAVRRAQEATAAAGVTAGFELRDFLHELPPVPFDYLWEHTLFCALPPGHRDAYVRALLRWLRPGATYLAVNYIVCDPDGPPWPVTPGELWQRLRPHFHLIDQWVPRSYPNRCGRELMVWWRRR